MKTVIVSGLTRCGSSLTMQMLFAGGMPISCAPGNEDVSGEYDSQFDALKALAAGHAQGKAIKCLDPHRFPIPKGDYIILWCCRDFKEQSKSIAKFMRAMLGVPLTRRNVKEIESNLPNETKECLDRLNGYPLYKIKFEDTLQNPAKSAEYLADILKDVIKLDVDKMAKVVKARTTDCYDGFLESEVIRDSNLKSKKLC